MPIPPDPTAKVSYNFGVIAAKALEDGKLDGFSVRVPTINVSLVDLTFEAGRATTNKEIDEAMKKASQGALKGVLDYNTAPLVSVDFNHSPASCVFDATQTAVVDGATSVSFSWPT
mgnify:CR=1 FL=1